MFNIHIDKINGDIVLSGRLDASQVNRASDVFSTITRSCVVDFKELDYISSAGLGVLLGTLKRLGESGGNMVLINMNNHIRDVFRYAGFDKIFEIK
jgi:anti-sigma B factor antagonist